MKTYEVIDFGDFEILQMTNGSGKVWTIPTDPANSDYAEYLSYTAWVEAGNTPEEFWTQTDELTEPKEEI